MTFCLEQIYGIMKGRWHLVSKKCKYKMHNVKYVVMVCLLLHNLCIARQDLCSPRLKSHFDELGLVERNIPLTENKGQSREIASKIDEWVWIHE